MKICVICEGSYPFVMGGVSSWLQALMKGMPEHTFTVWAIGAQQKQRGHFAYELPENVDKVHDVYLDEMLAMRLPRMRAWRLTEDQREAIYQLLICGTPDWNVIFHVFNQSKPRNLNFLSSHDFLSLAQEISMNEYPYVGFTDYFWTLRSMFMPLLYLLGETSPLADLYYSVSAGYAGVLGAMASARTGKPFLLTEHGIYTREREEEILQASWVPAQYKDHWVNMFYMFTRCAYQCALQVTSLFVRASLIQQEIGCSAGKCLVIPNGVHYQRFGTTPPKEANGHIDIGAIIRLVPIKDIKTMLYSFALVSSECKNVRLHIIGPTDEDPEYYQECVQLKDELGLQNVVFSGRTDVLAYMAKLDFTLLTSISEGQPLSILESMAASRPVITTDVGSCRELLEGNGDSFGPGGICVPVMHQTALAEAMITLCRNESLRKRMGIAGRRRVQASYGFDRMLERYKSLFENTVLDAKGVHEQWPESALN